MRPSSSLRYGAAVMLAGVLIATFGATRLLAQADAPGSYQESAPGLLTRSVFKAAAGSTTVEIIDLLVGPGKSSEPIVLAGGALLDAQGGSATLLVDGKGQNIQPGQVVSLAQGQQIAIDNSRGPRSFVARLVLLSRPGG
jgi:hypothetical protein